MNQEESLALFNKGKKEWNAWAARMQDERRALEEAGTWVWSSHGADCNYDRLDWLVRAKAKFSKHRFKNTADFCDFVFPGDADFQAATFEGGAYFNRAKFGDAAWFHEATFEGGVGFENAKFGDTTAFFQASFKEGASFDEATFKGRAYFYLAKFGDTTRFRKAKFGGEVTFHDATFERGVAFNGAEFVGEVAFHDATFERGVVFIVAKFRKAARFENAKFGATTAFYGTRFGGDVDFREATFEGGAGFYEATFEGDVGFGAIVSKGAYSLAGVTFLTVPDFIQAHFVEAPRFDDARIEPRHSSRLTLADVKNTFKGDRTSSARWRALKRLAVQGHDHMRELEFFKNEVRTRGWVTGRHSFVVALFGIFYGGLSDFGRSILRPLAWWAVSVALFWGLYLGVHLGHAKQPFSAAGWTFERIVQALGGAAAPQLRCVAGMPGHPAEAAGWLSLQKALLIFGQGSGAKPDRLHACLYSDVTQQSERFFADLPSSVIGLGIAQHLVSVILFFLLLLAIRNHFRIK